MGVGVQERLRLEHTCGRSVSRFRFCPPEAGFCCGPAPAVLDGAAAVAAAEAAAAAAAAAAAVATARVVGAASASAASMGRVATR